MPCNVDVHATYHMVGAVSPIRAEATLQIEMDRRQGRAALSHDRQSRRVSDKPKPRSWCTVYVYVCTSCAWWGVVYCLAVNRPIDLRGGDPV